MQLIVSDAEEKDCGKSSEITMESPECSVMQNKVLDTFKTNMSSDVDMNQLSDGNISEEPMDIDNSLVEPDNVDKEIAEDKENVNIDSQKKDNNSAEGNTSEKKESVDENTLENKDTAANNSESIMEVDENIAVQVNQREIVSDIDRNVDNIETHCKSLPETISGLKPLNENVQSSEKEKNSSLEDNDDISLNLEDDGDHESSGNVSFDLEKELNIERGENVSLKVTNNDLQNLSLDSEKSSDMDKDAEHDKSDTISTDVEKKVDSENIKNYSMNLDKVTEDNASIEDNTSRDDSDFITLNLSPCNPPDETDLCTNEVSMENVGCEAKNEVSNDIVESEATNGVSFENLESEAKNDMSNENVESEATNDVSNENVESESTNEVSNENDEKLIENGITIKTSDTEDFSLNDNLEKPILDDPHVTDSPKKSSEMNSNELATHPEVNAASQKNVESNEENFPDSVNKTTESSYSEKTHVENSNDTEVQNKDVMVESKLIAIDLKNNDVTEKSDDIELSLINGESNTDSKNSNPQENKNKECEILEENMETSDVKVSETVEKSEVRNKECESEILEENMENFDLKESEMVEKSEVNNKECEREILEENMETSDIKGSGTIEKSEFKNKECEREILEENMETSDIKGTGTIEKSEFKNKECEILKESMENSDVKESETVEKSEVKNKECESDILEENMETSDVKESEMVEKSEVKNEECEREILEENMETSDVKVSGRVEKSEVKNKECEILKENMETCSIKESEIVVKRGDVSNTQITNEESNVVDSPELKNNDLISATIENKDSLISQDNTKLLKAKEINIDSKNDSSLINDDGIKNIDSTDLKSLSVKKNIEGLQTKTKDNPIISTEKTTKDRTEGTVSKDDTGAKIISSNKLVSTSETMVLSDDDDDVALKISSDEKNMETTKDELKINTKQDNVESLNGNKHAVNSSSKTDQCTNTSELTNKENLCLALDDDDDDDIVLIDDGSSKTSDSNKIKVPEISLEVPGKSNEELKMDIDQDPKTVDDNTDNKPVKDFPISPLSIMKKIKPALDAMSREDLEEFLVVKIVESISGRSAISDIQLKLKSQEKSMEEWRKKVMTLSKQNKDLTIVLRNLLEEQQKKLKDNPIPIKITRSVGLQVGYPSVKTSSAPASTNVTPTNSSQVVSESNNASNISRQPIKPQPQPPKLVTPPAVNNVVTRRGRTRQSSSTPVGNTTPNASSPSPTPSSVGSNTSSQAPTPHITVRSKRSNPLIAPKLIPLPTVPVSNKNATSAPPRPLSKAIPEVHQKTAEKRPSLQSIDLTDDEPPAKIQAIRTPPRPVPTIRPINTNQLTSPNKLTYIVNGSGTAGTGARPVYIPINAQGQNVQPNSIMMRGKVLNKVNIRQITNAVRIGQPIPIRPAVHPAPLPQSINSKAQLHPTWKWIPPRPTLKIAKVENGIVISWEMDDFSEVQHEPIASYQIFAYQEASTQPTTDLWKKIGDVKALPLPMACTLTHFMSGFKYYFAVRAIDIRTRVGPFSAPGQITLMNKK